MTKIPYLAILSPISNNQHYTHKPTLTVEHKKRRRKLLPFLLGLVLSSFISILAHKKHSLSRSGIAGAVAAGTITTGSGGAPWAFALIFFFASSSLLSHFHKQEKEQTAADKFDKGSQRDLGQVLANGGVATTLALGHSFSRNARLRSLLEAGYVGALATANADTWATELGVLSQKTPRLITNGHPTVPGTSGGITLLGTGAAVSGALAEGLFFTLLRRKVSSSLPLIALIGGTAGSLFDSLLGATVQAIYYCQNCQKETEQRIHKCGTSTQYLRGLRWMNNDCVNFLATLGGACLTMLLHIPYLIYKKVHDKE